jgi:hypothetical protein
MSQPSHGIRERRVVSNARQRRLNWILIEPTDLDCSFHLLLVARDDGVGVVWRRLLFRTCVDQRFEVRILIVGPMGLSIRGSNATSSPIMRR